MCSGTVPGTGTASMVSPLGPAAPTSGATSPARRRFQISWPGRRSSVRVSALCSRSPRSTLSLA